MTSSYLYYADGSFTISNNPILTVNDEKRNILKSVLIGSIVTELNTACFDNCSISTITIPPTISSLSESCFYGCIGLKSINLPNTITNFGNSCFYNCSALRIINIPNSVNSIGESCFNNCFSLNNITIPNSVNSLGVSCFNNCFALTTVVLSTSLIELPENCFNNCYSLQSISLPNILITLGNNCFYACQAIQTINLNKCQTIGNNCFYGCNALTELFIPASVINIGDNFIDNCFTLFSVIFENQHNIQSILPNSFVNVRPYTSITFYNTTNYDNLIPKMRTALSNATNPLILIYIAEPYIWPINKKIPSILYKFNNKSDKKRTQKKINKYIDELN